MYSSTLSLTSALDRGGRLRRSPTALTPGRTFGTYSTEGWVGPRAGVDGVENLGLHRNWNPRPSTQKIKDVWKMTM
jgi:hypothetical protein